MHGMEIIDPDPGPDAPGGGVAHMAARGRVVPDGMEMQTRNRLTVGVVREAEAHERALPGWKGEARLILDDLAERLALVRGRGHRAEDDIGELTGDLDGAHDLLMFDVSVLEEGVERSEDAIDIGARRHIYAVLPASMGGDTEGDAVIGVDLPRPAIDRDPPGGASDADDLTVEVVHHAETEPTAPELLAHRRAGGVVPGKETARCARLLHSPVPTETLVQCAPQMRQDSVMHGVSVRDVAVDEATSPHLRIVSPVTLLPSADPDTAALLFDCDGTLVDTMSVHRVVWAEIFGRYGFTMTDAWWADYCNVALVPFVQAAIPDAGVELAEELNRESMVTYMDAIHLVEPMEHVIEIAHEHHGRLPMAVVTGGYREIIIPTLDAAGITHLFDVVVTADDVAHSKPAPDVYARAASLLQVDPARCIAYEDSEIGMESARGAGIGRVVDIRLT